MADKAYAVDFVLNVMKAISSTEPVLFQRDGALYVASGEGFGQVTYGLRTRPEKIESWEGRSQAPEINESEDAIQEWVKDELHGGHKPIIKKSEKPYLKAICFGPDDNSFSLEEITVAAKGLAKLGDDGKIRMISNESSYHSHKYGYAADGIDVWLQEARVIDKDKYLKLIRDEEEGIIKQMEHIGDIKEIHNIESSYNNLTLPNCVILTNYMIVSLPRGGKLHIHRDEPDSWTQRTKLSANNQNGSILYGNKINNYRESPFRVNVKVNAQLLNESDNRSFEGVMQSFQLAIHRELSAVNSNMALAKRYVAKFNEIHNKVFAPKIKWQKSLRKIK